jgi:hypothetical protein
MPDPFTIIGLLDTLIGWSLEIYKFLSAVSDAPRGIASLANELHILRGIFPLVKDVAVKISNSSILANDSQWLPALQSVLEECRAEFKKLLTYVVGSKQDMYIHTWERLYRKASWVLANDALQGSINRLERYKSCLQLILQVSTM